MPVIMVGVEHTHGVQSWYAGVCVLLTRRPLTIAGIVGAAIYDSG
jgi:hypothetical protein